MSEKKQASRLIGAVSEALRHVLGRTPGWAHEMIRRASRAPQEAAMNFPFYVREYVKAFSAANGREPTVAQSGSWWEIDGKMKAQKNDLVRMTIILEGRAARQSK